MSEAWNIKGLEDILSENLENGENITDKKITALTAPGENYGSIMLRVDLTVKNERTGKSRILHTVAKLVPESEMTQAIFNTQVTYRNEYKFYAQIIPTLDKILKSRGISSGAEFVAPFYGGRLNLNNSEKVNSDAIILMENLKIAGYTIGQKREGFDIEVSKLVLNALAKLHAAGIALRTQEPETFKEKIAPYLHFYLTGDNIYNKVQEKVANELGGLGFTPGEVNAVAVFKQMEVVKPKISDTWGTISHNDSWTNNFMIKYEGNKPVHVVVVDFQICDYRSALNDVMFFLFSSVRQDIFDDSVDVLLDFYYKHLLDYLKRLGVDTKPFTRNSFEEEIEFAVQHPEYAHALWMLFPIMHEELKSVEDFPNVSMDWSEEHLAKIAQVTRLCFKKGWLKAK